MNQTSARAYAILEYANAVMKDGHFVYQKGDHGPAYVNKDRIYLYPKLVSRLCELIAIQFKDHNIEAVVAPAMGALMLSTWTAYHLTEITGRQVIATYADKKDKAAGGGFEIRRGYNFEIAGKRTLVVEDILNSGDTAQQVVRVAREVGAQVVALGALCNRGDSTAETIDVGELFALVNVKMDKYPADNCPLCQKGVAINTNVGHGADFLAKQAAKA